MRRLPCWPLSPKLVGVRSLSAPALVSLRVFHVSGFEKMLVFYLPRPDGVELLRVVHGSRNLRTLLRREEDQ